MTAPASASAPFRQPRSSRPTIQARSTWAAQSPSDRVGRPEACRLVLADDGGERGGRIGAPGVEWGADLDDLALERGDGPPIGVEDGLRPIGQDPRIADEQPAELDRDRAEHRHLPVDERDPAIRERRDIAELEVAVEPRRGQLAERGQQRSPGRRRGCARARRRPTTPAGRRPSSPRGTARRRRRRRQPVAQRIEARAAAAARPAAPSARRSPGRRGGDRPGAAWRRATAARIRSMPPASAAPRRAPSRAACRSGRASAWRRAVPSAAAPKYGATSGSGSGNGVAAMNPSRSAWSRVERAIQSTAQDVRLSTNAAPSEGRTSRVSEAPDQPSLANAASGRRPARARRAGRERPPVPVPQHGAGTSSAPSGPPST